MLRRYPYGESSLVVHVFTREHGKLSLLAKGAYRPRSRYFGVLDLFDTLRIEWRASARSELALLSAAAIEVRRRALSGDLERYRTALAILEFLDLAALPGRGDVALFDLGELWLDLLRAGRVAPGVALVAFDLRFLHNLGLGPALRDCAACGRSAPPARRGGSRVAFSTGAGGRLCTACAAEARAAGRNVETAPVGTLRIAQSLLEAPPDTLHKFRLDPGPAREVRRLLQRFLDYHLETRSRTRTHLTTRSRAAAPR